jgi:hypothetical protein
MWDKLRDSVARAETPQDYFDAMMRTLDEIRALPEVA